MCLGRNLGPPVMQLILIAVVQRYALHFRPRYPGDPIPDFGFELSPRGPTLMTVHRAAPAR
jgi:hypothetical protein